MMPGARVLLFTLMGDYIPQISSKCPRMRISTNFIAPSAEDMARDSGGGQG